MSVNLEFDPDIFSITKIVKSQVEKQARLFIICNDCFWCASALNTRQLDVDLCPKCNKPIFSLPITHDERISACSRTEHTVKI